jgi:hypothetical protein
MRIRVNDFLLRNESPVITCSRVLAAKTALADGRSQAQQRVHQLLTGGWKIVT